MTALILRYTEIAAPYFQNLRLTSAPVPHKRRRERSCQRERRRAALRRGEEGEGLGEGGEIAASS